MKTQILKEHYIPNIHAINILLSKITYCEYKCLFIINYLQI